MALKLIFLLIAVGCWCYLIGFYLGRKPQKVRDGVFLVNLSDPEKDIFTVEMETPFDSIPSKKWLHFQVVMLIKEGNGEPKTKRALS